MVDCSFIFDHFLEKNINLSFTVGIFSTLVLFQNHSNVSHASTCGMNN